MPKKELYDYQAHDINQIFQRIDSRPSDYNLLYQLPTGGGKTVIFSEIARRYIELKKKKVVILTHRIELSRQTSDMLSEFEVHNKVIDSSVKALPDQDEYECFVAMVETLNNRLSEDNLILKNIGLVIIDEAHYNSFRKLFKFFDHCFILGVTATPLSSNIKLPMNEIYKELITGHSIGELIGKGYLSQATTFSYDVGLTSLKVGINGDYTVKSSEILYSNTVMQNKLLQAYEERTKGKKVLIFNAGINTSRNVYRTFLDAGYPVRHLDSTCPAKERRETLEWFKKTPNGILTSVGILTTGFDEPTVRTIILNRATRSLTLYFQMIGRGSRVLSDKSTFDIIDLGNNAKRFGLWEADTDWQNIFKHPDFFLENLRSDEEIERYFKYDMPDDLRAKFPHTEQVQFDIEATNDLLMTEGLRSSLIIDRAVEQHAQMCVDNSTDIASAYVLVRLLDEDIEDRVRRYCYCICKSTKNYRAWVKEEYIKKLKSKIVQLCQARLVSSK